MKKQQEVTKRIKTFEDAMKETGRPNVPDFSNLPADLRDYFEAQYKIIVITEALNEDFVADWNDDNQRKYFPWFYASSGVFAYNATFYYCSFAAAGDGARLCFSTRELAEYAGKQFLEIWTKILKK